MTVRSAWGFSFSGKDFAFANSFTIIFHQNLPPTISCSASYLCALIYCCNLWFAWVNNKALTNYSLFLPPNNWPMKVWHKCLKLTLVQSWVEAWLDGKLHSIPSYLTCGLHIFSHLISWHWSPILPVFCSLSVDYKVFGWVYALKPFIFQSSKCIEALCIPF